MIGVWQLVTKHIDRLNVRSYYTDKNLRVFG
jgi:hypothetical protein